MIEEIAHGGVGIVYKACQRSLHRVVAVKMLLAGAYASEESRRRFRAEAEAAALLQHPHIVAIHEIGEQDGQVFFSMDYVEGSDLAELVRHQPLPARRAARYLRLMAEAVHYAHQHGVLHRDLKPSNVLIDGCDQPRITDFGLAKQLNAEVPTTSTLPGQVMGSPSYLPPEQASGRQSELGVGCDIYALGAILYHALTGKPPFQADSVAMVLQQVMQTEPVRPSVLNPGVPRDLETVCLKCLEKEPQRRYPSARSLADDLDRFLRDEPVRARPLGPGGRLWRWTRRNPMVAAPTAAVLALLVASAVGASLVALHLQRSERTASLRLQAALAAQAQAGRRSGQPGRRFDSLQALKQATDLARRLRLEEGERLRLRNETLACLALSDLRVIKQWRGLENPSAPATVDGDLRLWATLGSECTARVGGGEDDRIAAVLGLPGESFHESLLSADGRWLALKHHSKRVTLWDVEARRLHASFQSREGPAMDFSEDSAWLVLDQADRSLLLVELATGQRQVLPATTSQPIWLRFSPGGRRLAMAGLEPPMVEVWDLPHRTGRKLPHRAIPQRMAWHPDGRLLAVPCMDGQILIWDTEAAQVRNVLERRQVVMGRVEFHPSGRLLASWSWDGATRLWDPFGDAPLLTVPGTEMLRFSRDGHRLAFKSGLQLGLWEVSAAEESRRLSPMPPTQAAGDFRSVGYSPDGRLLLGATRGGVHLWHCQTLEEVGFLPMPGCHWITRHPKEPWLLTCGETGILRWPYQVFATNSAREIVIGPPERMLMASNRAARKIVFDGAGRRPVVEMFGPRQGWILQADGQAVLVSLAPSQFHDVAVSPDGRWVASGNWHGSGATLWEAESGRMVCVLPTAGSTSVAFSADNAWLVTGTGAKYQFWRVGSWEPAHHLDRAGGGDYPGVMAFSPDRALMALAHSRAAVRLVETSSGRELATLDPTQFEEVYDLRFSPDGGLLAVASSTAGVRVWDLRLLRQRLAAVQLDWEPPSHSYPSRPAREKVEVLVRPHPAGTTSTLGASGRP